MRRLVAAAIVSLACVVCAGAASTSIPRVRLVSVAWDGSWPDSYSHDGALSANGGLVAFTSGARNIVRSGKKGTFLRDLRARRTRRIIRPAGAFELAFSRSGRFLVFCTGEAFARGDTKRASDQENLFDVYVYDRGTQRISWVSARRWGKFEPIPACSGKAGAGGKPDISATGRFVAFATAAPQVVRGDTNRSVDVFVRDMAMHRTTRASVSSLGKQANGQSGAPAISDDGRYVSFCSLARNLTRARVPLGGGIFVRDLTNAKTKLATVTRERRPLADRSFCTGRRVLSAHGRYLAFLTDSPDVVGDLRFAREHEAQLVVANLRKRTFDVISTGTTGEGANSGIETMEMTPDGRYLAFATLATNMVHDDRNGLSDVFWFDRVTRRTVRVSVRSDGTDSLSQTGSRLNSISADGRWVTWETADPDVVPGEPRRPSGEDTYDVFITGPLH
jgi:hypothetical protein